MYAKFSQCTFVEEEVKYLGHIISGDGVRIDLNKVATMVEWPKLMTVKELRGFLGLTKYYRKFIQHYELISRPLIELLEGCFSVEP